MLSRLDGQTLGTDAGTHKRFPHRQGFENLDPRPAAYQQRDHHDRCLGPMWPNIRNGADYLDPVHALQAAYAAGWIAADNPEDRLGSGVADPWPNFLHEMYHAVLVRHPVQRTDKHNVVGMLGRTVWPEVIHVHRGVDSLDMVPDVFAGKGLPILFADSDDRVEESAAVRFEAAHPPPLQGHVA